MNKPAGPWALVRHLWARNFQQNPVGTVAGSLLTVGAAGFMLFFGFFVVIALMVAGGLFMLANAVFGMPARRPSRPGPETEPSPSDHNNQRNNNELEGEFTVVSDKESERS